MQPQPQPQKLNQTHNNITSHLIFKLKDKFHNLF